MLFKNTPMVKPLVRFMAEILIFYFNYIQDNISQAPPSARRISYEKNFQNNFFDLFELKKKTLIRKVFIK